MTEDCEDWVVECLKHEECWVETEVREDGRTISYCMCDDS